MPHYALVTTDGVALGATELNGQDWKAGDVIHRGAGDSLRVVDVLDSDDAELFAILVVAEA